MDIFLACFYVLGELRLRIAFVTSFVVYRVIPLLVSHYDSLLCPLKCSAVIVRMMLKSALPSLSLFGQGRFWY
jgi:hypothetical protein